MSLRAHAYILTSTFPTVPNARQKLSVEFFYSTFSVPFGTALSTYNQDRDDSKKRKEDV